MGREKTHPDKLIFQKMGQKKKNHLELRIKLKILGAWGKYWPQRHAPLYMGVIIFLKKPM